MFKENDLDCIKFHHWGPVMRFEPKGHHDKDDYEVINYDFSVIVLYRDMFVLEICDASYDEPYVGEAQTEDIFFHDNDEEESKERLKEYGLERTDMYIANMLFYEPIKKESKKVKIKNS